ncbi:MAG: ROK family protein [Coriobacteriia bacterium]|nr:ROK family protein [Coriobacteriia bacterium]
MKPCNVVAIDLGGTKIAGALVRYESDGQAPVIVARTAVPTNAQEGGENVLARVISVAKEMAAASDEQPVGVGIAAAGCISPDDGSVLYANEIMPGWTGQPLAAATSQALGVPAAAMGDVHGHALGETRWGGAKGLSSCLFVAAGTGMGGAYVVDGKVLRGAHGAAGHIGHTIHPAASGFTCACGGQDHVEAVTSGTGIGCLYQGASLTNADYDPAVTGAQVSERAEQGEQKAVDALKAAGFALGQAMGSWANILDPAAIVLTGTVVNAGPLWRQALNEGYASQAMPPMRETPIVAATLGGDAPLIGAAEHLLDSLAEH